MRYSKFPHSFDKYTHLQLNLFLTVDSTQSLVYDILQLSVLHKGRLMFNWEEGLRCGVIYLRTPTEQLQTIEQGSKTLICISFTKLNIPLLLERVFLNFLWIFIDCYSTASKCYKETPQIP
ncbi:hypothetical protein CSKR_101964 [Clonorchis sinensis]|uniref:Uncharacterized protein n=1 Tax=Clonorchis sinensis TaxID=79923 RepID=A0A3R7H917_CLOSI|nr:hypothetical protein CSKR_101964 [Clonorchis sinensis]